jgi:hypothetical protein
MLRISSLFALVVCAQALSGQSGSYGFLGTDCKNNTVPAFHFRNIGLPKIGKNFWIETNPSLNPPSALWRYFLVTGVSNKRFGSLKLPFSIQGLSGVGRVFCGTLWNSMDLMQMVPVATKPVRTSFAIPNNRSFLGLRFYQQVLLYRSDPFEITVALSKGGVGRIGL